MKKFTILLLLIPLCSLCFGQTTHIINWQIGSANINLEIERGDLVEWVWGDDLTHTVTSKAGSKETFDSGFIIGNGMTYTKKFNFVGENPFECTLHPGTMFGNISVRAPLSIDDNKENQFQLYPNPVVNNVNISSPFQIKNINIYNILGVQVLQKSYDSNEVSIDMTAFSGGIYFIQVASERSSTTYKVFKK